MDSTIGKKPTKSDIRKADYLEKLKGGGNHMIEFTSMGSRGTLMDFPLGVSTNARMQPIKMGKYAIEVLTEKARWYLAIVSKELRSLHELVNRRNVRVTIWDEHFILPCWIIMPRTNCDPHNYYKIMFDVLEKAGLVSNDKFIIDQMQGIGYNAKDPRFIMLWPRRKSK